MSIKTIHHEVDSIYTSEQKVRRIERIKRKVEINANGCWIYHGQTLPSGYVHIRFGNRLWAGHRLMYAMAKGPIPPGMFVCHTCDVRNCINPEHLWLGTPKDNSQDCASKGRVHGQTLTSCKRGHPLDESNSYRHAGRRHCRICQADRGTAYQEKKKLERRRRGRKPRKLVKHPLHLMQVGETYRPTNPTKYFRRHVWNSGSRLGRTFSIVPDGPSFIVTRMA